MTDDYVEQIDLTRVRVQHGDYVVDDLEQAATDITDEALRQLVRHGYNRETWMVFCPTIKHAHLVRDKLRERRVSCETIIERTPQKERETILNRLRSGKLRAVTNVATLTTGVDVPNIDLIACLRPTKSTALYVQMLGRGTRTAPGKDNCLVLDFAGLLEEHGPVDQATPKPKGKGDGEAWYKFCPQCQEKVAAATRQCPECGYQFPWDDSLKITPEPARLPALSDGEWIEPVYSVTYHRHQKPGKLPSLRVEFTVSRRRQICEWWQFEYGGRLRREGEAAWQLFADNDDPVPATVDEALARLRELRTPSKIIVCRDQAGYTKVVAAEFQDSQAALHHRSPLR